MNFYDQGRKAAQEWIENERNREPRNPHCFGSAADEWTAGFRSEIYTAHNDRNLDSKRLERIAGAYDYESRAVH